MEHTAQPATSPTISSFAGLLASLAARVGPDSGSGADQLADDKLADDVATISYESALRAQGRTWPAGTDDSGLNSGGLEFSDGGAAQTKRPETGTFEGVQGWQAVAGIQRATDGVPACERDRKCASITIRISVAEAAQLRQRAAEAGLTVSAYLRSCAFEMESLRAQVKDTVARLKATGPESQAATAGTEKRGLARAGRSRWFWPFRHSEVGIGGQGRAIDNSPARRQSGIGL